MTEQDGVPTQDREKAEVPNAFFASVCDSKPKPQEPQIPETTGITGSKKDLVLVEEDPVREILSRLDVYLFYAPTRGEG